MKTTKIKTIEYGYLEEQHSFCYYGLLVNEEYKVVTIYKCKGCISNGTFEEELESQITLEHWMIIKKGVEIRLNETLKNEDMYAGRWNKNGTTRLNKILGDELLILFWGTEHLDIRKPEDKEKLIIATRCWANLSTIELRYLHMKVDTSAENWRRAVKYMLQ